MKTVLHICLTHNEIVRAFIHLIDKSEKLQKGHKHVFIMANSDLAIYALSLNSLNHIEIVGLEYPWGKRSLLEIIRHCHKADEIFHHYVSFEPYAVLSMLFPWIRRKSAWIIWGGDAYNEMLQPLPENRLRISDRIRNLTYKWLLKQFPYVLSAHKGEYDRVSEIVGKIGKYLWFSYPIMLDFSVLDFLKSKPNSSFEYCCETVLVGNSACPTNNHVEILRALKVYYDANRFQIICPLSYSSLSQDYIEKVISIGRDFFGQDFKPYLEFLSAEQYTKLLNQCSVAIMNHTRHRALGTTRTLLYLKKVVFLRSESYVYQYLKELGLSVFKTDDLLDGNIACFTRIFEDFDGSENSRIIREHYSNEYLEQKYFEVFNKVGC